MPERVKPLEVLKKQTPRKPQKKKPKTPATPRLTEPRLTDKQKLFVSYYVQHWNATKAARQAGYSDPECSGFENRQKPAIEEAIRARIAQVAMSADEVLMRLADQARGVHADYWEFWNPRESEWSSADESEMNDDEIDFRDRERTKEALLKRVPHLNIERMIADGRGHLIKELKAEAGMLCEVKFYDAQAALIQLGRHHKLFTDKIEADVTARPISHDDTADFDGMDRAELNRGIEAALKAAASG